MKPLVSAIVTTKNGKKTIVRCLRSLQQQTYKNLEIIVVDNHSKDGTVALAKEFTKQVYTKGPERSAQRNYGAKKAKGSYYFFLDADMQLHENTVANCVRAIRSGVEGVMVKEIFVGKGFWSKSKALEKNCYTGTGDGEAARFYTKAIFAKVGGYDETLTGPEDIDMHKRVAAQTSLGRAGTIVHYDEHISYLDFLKKRYYYSFSYGKYLAKHPNIRKSEFKFVRKAYLQNWKLLLSDPIHLIGFFFLRFGEGIAVLLALRKTR